MTDYVLFTNIGEIPVNAFKLLGASSKRGDNSKIGFYGTGLKYALALMLREGIGFKIYSGKHEIKITKRTTKFLDQKIDVMVVNGEKTSITLDAGIDWEPWFAIREIYSNTIDEGGTMKLNAQLEPEAGTTKIYIDLTAPQLDNIFQNWGDYFTTSRPIVEKLADGSILSKLPSNPKFTVFRKGIRAFNNEYHSLFDYDLRNLTINESRVAKYGFETEQNSSRLLAKASLDTVLKFIDLGKKESTRDYVEWQNSFWEYTSSNFSREWLIAIDNRKLIPNDYAGRYDHTDHTLVLPDKLIKRLKDAFGHAVHVVGEDDEPYTIIDDLDMAPVDKSLKLLQKIGIDFPKEDIFMADFYDNSILGTINNRQVILNSRLLNSNSDNLDAVLLEEIVHATTGHADSTRSMQTHLFNMIITLAKDGRV